MNFPESDIDRRRVVSEVIRALDEPLVVSGLGSSTWDVAAAGDRDTNFYLWGSMGSAAMVGLGLALAQAERRIVVITGDGEMMMGIGSLATIAAQAPSNLVLLVLDNGLYLETGGQRSHSGRGADIAAAASALGITTVRRVKVQLDLTAVLIELPRIKGPALISVAVSTVPAPVTLPPRDGTFLRQRFRRAILGNCEEAS